jgi:NAD(P)-dependent dehydrogenase (short-subunit alcohol dehydrogenase family)
MSSAVSAHGAARGSPLAGKSILVTGGGSGLGAALCQVLAGAGAAIVVGDIRRDSAERIAGLLREEGAQAHPLAFDVGEPEDARQAIDVAISACGRLDVLINNAGTDITCPIEELDYADWNRVIHTNLYGPFLMSKYAAQHMREQKGGAIVNIASTAARRAWPNASAYHASKWGVLGLSHALHAELRPHNIKVTAVIAGGMRTPFLLDRFPDIDLSTLQDPRNVAEAVLAVLQLPAETVIPEIMVLPMKESSWP